MHCRGLTTDSFRVACKRLTLLSRLLVRIDEFLFMPVSVINVLLVDDSGFMRLILADMLEVDSQIHILGTAENGKEAFEKTKLLKPDVVVLDLTMKDYDGLYAVKHIMQDCPTPIVILSALGNTNAEAVFEALDAGAYDFQNKPSAKVGANIRTIENQLVSKIKQASQVDLQRLRSWKTNRNTFVHAFDAQLPYSIVVIGASTGGTGAIEDILEKLPGNFPLPIVIAQHMPKDFIHSYVNRLDGASPLKIKVAQQGEALVNGTVYFAPGDCNMLITHESNHTRRVDFTDQLFPEYNFPSVNALMLSVAEIYGSQAISIILTGMGKDGMLGMQAMHGKKAITIAQDEKTSVVFGMPKAAIQAGAVQRVLSLDDIPGFVVSCLS